MDVETAKALLKLALVQGWKNFWSAPYEPDPLRDLVAKQKQEAAFKERRDANFYAKRVAKMRADKGLPPL